MKRFKVRRFPSYTWNVVDRYDRYARTRWATKAKAKDYASFLNRLHHDGKLDR